jgi:hypothetical protein
MMPMHGKGFVAAVLVLAILSSPLISLQVTNADTSDSPALLWSYTLPKYQTPPTAAHI